MESKAEAFFQSIQAKKVAFIGIGVSHTELIRLMAGKGIACTLCDRRTEAELGDAAAELRALGVALVLGEGYLDTLTDYDIIFRSPGVYYNNPKLTAARAAGRVVTSEMEVFLELCPCKKYAVTGSDGKTTTTTLICELLRAQGKTVHIGGNIGKPLLCHVEQMSPEDCAVVELSSFQLISMRQAVDVAVVTNVAPNHLDIHGTMEEYIAAKKQLVLHQNAFSRTVLNRDNSTTASFAPLVRGELCWFSHLAPTARGTFLDAEGYLCAAGDEGITRLLHRDEIRIPGLHNVENYLAAAAAVWGTVSAENIKKVAKEFGGVEHRIEFIRTVNGVKWYNDSIATSPTRAIAGLNAFSQRVILIAGGYDKHIPFEPLAPVLMEKVKDLILTGATADKIEAVVTSYEGYDPARLKLHRVKDLPAAVQKAYELAQSGDIVTLSPACASFDSYKNFELRGKHFKEMVGKLE